MSSKKETSRETKNQEVEDATTVRVSRNANPGANNSPEDITLLNENPPTASSQTTERKTLHSQKTQVKALAENVAREPKQNSGGNANIDAHAATIATTPDAPSGAKVEDLGPLDTANLREGTRLRNRFILDRRLGAGGMGQVFLARDLRREEMHDNTHVAIKFLSPKLSKNTYDYHMFLVALQREAKKAQKLAHPNIVTVFDFDRDGDVAFLSMEYLKGKALNEYVTSKRTLSSSQAMHITERVARGLAYAHQEGYVHADIKPPNIFITDQGLVKILDFGIAQAVQQGQAGENTTVMDSDEPNISALTPMYSSLEMLEGESPLPSDDVYALCCTTYRILTNRHPYTDEDDKPLTAVQARDAEAKIKNIPELSRRHMKALRKGLALRRSKRFKNAGEFIDAIKPRSLKRDIGTIVLSLMLVVALISVWIASLPEKPVTLEDLDPALESVRLTIEEGDSLLAVEDIDLAHRLYAQAWDTSVEMPDLPADSLQVLNSLLNQRANQIADKLISAAHEENLDEFRIRQLQLALEFLVSDTLGTKDEEINQTLEMLDEKIKLHQEQ